MRKWRCEIIGYTTVEATTRGKAMKKAAEVPYDRWDWCPMDAEVER